MLPFLKNFKNSQWGEIRKVYFSKYVPQNMCRYAVRAESFRTFFLKNQKTHEEDARLFLFKISSIGIRYRILRSRTVSEKLAKIPLFGLCFNHHLRLLGSQQRPQTGVLLSSFSTRGTENNLAEINLEITGVINGCNIFCGSKIDKHLQLCGRVHYRATRKNLES